MNMTDPNHDPRFDIAHDERFDKKSILIKNQDGSWKERSPQVRLDVLTSIGYNESKIATLNQTKLSSKGYMQSPRDWKNAEMTGFVKFNKGNSEKRTSLMNSLGMQEEEIMRHLIRDVRGLHTKDNYLIMAIPDLPKSSIL
jgi:hypothetical protein